MATDKMWRRPDDSDEAEVACHTCFFWERGGNPIATKVDFLPNDELGVCLLNPPVATPSIGGAVLTAWPQTHSGRHCAHWLFDGGGEGGDGGSKADAPNDGNVHSFPRRAA